MPHIYKRNFALSERAIIATQLGFIFYILVVINAISAGKWC